MNNIKLYFCFLLQILVSFLNGQSISLDKSFGNSNAYEFVHFIDQIDCYATEMALTSDNRIILLSNMVDPNSGDEIFALSKHLQNGQLDSTFGNNGKIFSPNLSPIINGRTIIQDKLGRILIGGFLKENNHILAMIYRYTPSGKVDMTFGTMGILKLPLYLHAGQDFETSVNSLTCQKDGKYLILISTFGFPNQSYIVRLNQNGTTDLNFGIQGISEINNQIKNKVSIIARKIGLDKNEHIICAGDMTSNIESSPFVAKFDSLGALDSDFAKGLGFINLKMKTNNAILANMQIGSLDEIVGIGTNFNSNTPFDQDIFIFKINSNGSPELNFGSQNGTQYFGTKDVRDYPINFQIQKDGKYLLLYSSTDLNNHSTTSLERLFPNAFRDNSFGLNGIIDISSPNSNELSLPGYANFLLMSNGKLLLVGSAYTQNNQYSIMVRYNYSTTTEINSSSSQQLKYLIYPNPASDMVYLDLESDQLAQLDIDIINLYGDRIKSICTNCNSTFGKLNIKLPIFNLPAGHYIVRIKTSQTTKQIPIVIE